VKIEMQAYRLYTVVPKLLKFVDQLTNWYVRMNRRRLKGDMGQNDCMNSLSTLFEVLYSMTKVMAPFIPFLTEFMYQHLRSFISSSAKEEEINSIHYLMLPQPKESLIDTPIEMAVARMQSVIELGRVLRDKNVMPMKYPLKEIVVIHKDEECLQDIANLENYIMEELNLKIVKTSRNKTKYGVKLEAQPDFKVLGGKLKNDMKKVMNELKNIGDEKLSEFQESGVLLVLGYELTADEVALKYAFDTTSKEKKNHAYEAHSNGDILVLLDVTPDQSMVDEGLAREVINRVQRLRKEAKLETKDDITIYYKAPENLHKIISSFSEFIYATIKQPMKQHPVPNDANIIIKDTKNIKGNDLELTIARGHSGCTPEVSMSLSQGQPICRFVNVELCGVKPQGGVKGTQATVLLENPCGEFILDVAGLSKQVAIIFGLQPMKLSFYTTKDKSKEISDKAGLLSSHRSTLYAFKN